MGLGLRGMSDRVLPEGDGARANGTVSGEADLAQVLLPPIGQRSRRGLDMVPVEPKQEDKFAKAMDK